MAHPFGGHPTLAAYIDWIRSQGGSASSGMSNVRGRMHSLTKIIAANGNHVIVIGTRQDERLVPTMVGYLDRRLDVKSPWVSLPPDFV